MEEYSKNLRSPDESVRFPGIVEDLVNLGDLTVGRVVQEPGWRWSTHLRPIVGGDWCQARHVGVVVSGRFGALLSNGAELTFSPEDVYDIPPGHDGYTVGDEPVVLIEWSGMRALAGFRLPSRNRALVTLLFTDIVASTSTAALLGDLAWRDLLSGHFLAARSELDRYGGRQVSTTGDGLLATFASPTRALPCAAAIRRLAERDGLEMRGGVHVGEVEMVGDEMRGLAVHEAARIMAEADPGEILVSELTRELTHSAGLDFADRGTRRLKGLDGEWRLYAFLGSTSVA